MVDNNIDDFDIVNSNFYKLILEQLIENKQFREIFSQSPRSALNTLGISLTEQETKEIEQIEMNSSIRISSEFYIKNPLCCSVGY